MHAWLVLLAVYLSIIYTVPASAQTSEAPLAQAPATVPGGPLHRPLWELGVGAVAVDQQAYPGSSAQVQRMLVLPYFIYRGEVLRAESGGVGLRAIRRPRYEVDVGFAGAFGSGSSVPARIGMPSIGALGEVGPRLRIRLGSLDKPGHWRINLPLRAVLDLSEQLRYRGLAFEPALVFSRALSADWRLTARLGAVIGDQRLTSLFYSVAPPFATSTRPAYEAKAGLISTRFGLAFSRRINKYVSLRLFARLDSVAGAANRNSPLVDKTTGYSAGIGVSWTFRESSQRAVR
ncbi:MAG: MipA/OmpV family protein [Burkholderiaceae bacterium]